MPLRFFIGSQNIPGNERLRRTLTSACDQVSFTPWEPDLGSVLGAVHGSILNGPQGTQRCLLRLGHSPDPRDIEPLVGPVAPQRAEMLATLQVPERDGPIIPTTGQRAPIRTPSHAVYMPDEGSSLPLPICALPPACCQRPSTARCG